MIHILFRWLISALALLCALSATAGNISIMPVVVDLSAQKVRESITITNQDTEATTVHVEVVAWSQSQGKEVFTPTTDVLLNPSIFTLPPRQSQVLRIGWKGKTPIDTERTYRIMLREVPKIATDSSPAASPAVLAPSSVRVLLELRIPIYVAPQQPQPHDDWQAKRIDANTVSVHYANRGNVHSVVHSIQLASNKLGVNAAVLAGQEREWLIPIKSTDAADLRVDVLAQPAVPQLVVAQ